jgi:type I restriction enzyme S subunit
MSFPSYPEYADTKFKWIGAIPNHWELKPLKSLTKCMDGKRIPLNGEQRSYKRGDVPYWGANAIMDYVDGCIFDEDLLLVGEDGAPFLDPLKPVAFFSSGPVWPNNHIHVLRPNKTEWAKFLVRSLNATDYATFIEGATRQKLTQSRLMNIPVCWPSKSERSKISYFLDHETAKIDTLIHEQKRLIELLQEKRQAVISHAVTKGLDSNVPMKDSGVEWLGEVPTHWSVGKLRWYATIQGGIAKGKDYVDKETVTVPYLRVANVQSGYVDLRNVKEISVLESEVERYSLKIGDVLMNEGGDNDKLGRGAVWRGQVAPCLHQNHVFAIRPNQHLSPEWLTMFTQSNRARFYFFLNSKQSTNLASISSSNVMSLDLPMPSPSEQGEILAFLTEEILRFSELQSQAEKGVGLLQERRSALISAAVTGKIDVRDWQPPVNKIAFDEEVRQAGMEVTV